MQTPVRMLTSILILTLAACSVGPMLGTGTSDAPTAGPETQGAAQPSPTATSDSGAQGQAALIELAADALSDHLGAPAQAIGFLGLERVDWSDASLGCPEPDESYAQVLVPGFKLQFSYEGQIYTLHTDMDGWVKLCSPGTGELANPKGIEGTIRDGHPNQPVEIGTIVPKPIR